MRGSFKVRLLAPALAACTLAAAGGAFAQSIEPRAYSNAPVGVNFLVAGYAYTSGGLSFDPALPITDDQLRTSSEVLAYARTLDLWGSSGKFDVIVPYTELDGSAEYAGQPVTRTIHGLGDPAFRLSMNFYGAPAMSLREFAGWRQDLIVGASVQVSPPLGQYDPSRIVNLGMNRWAVKPELGASKTEGPWTLEAKLAATFFTDNSDFYGGQRRSQDPIYSASAHAIYNFASGIWASCDATYFAGGRTTIDGAKANDLQQNWRAGATLAIPIDRTNSIKLYASRGLSARTGNSFDLLGIAWQLRWGGGL
ncbi:MAG TPA: transporter [Usitatibacter sp.]|nr:transporter [Usitatibacter sp.]